MDSRLVSGRPPVVYLRHYRSVFENPLSNLKPVVLMEEKKQYRQESKVIISVFNQPFRKLPFSVTLLIMSKSWCHRRRGEKKNT